MEQFTMPADARMNPPQNNRRKKIIILVSIIVVLLLGGFVYYWFFVRDTAITEQDKMDILTELKQSSTIDFTPEAKDQIVQNLASESHTDNPTAMNMSEEQKLDIINGLGGQK